MRTRWIIGIDEAGRGPLAGPVAVGVFAIPRGFKLKVLKRVKDSKQLNEYQREEIFKEIEQEKSEGRCFFEVAQSSSHYIDTYGIVPAIKNAMEKALRKLNLDPNECEVVLDGSLKAPEEYRDQKTIIKGDATIPVISAASICAKVLRDRYMTKISKKYKQYDFHQHKGYGTVKHIRLLKSYGVTSAHRKSFLKSLL